MPPKLSENSDKISYYEFASTVLSGENLDEKRLAVQVDFNEWKPFELPKFPGRSKKLAFSEERIKFPKTFHEKEKTAIALHSFANHELLAIEMMAAALLIYPHKTEDDIRFKRGILNALKDEQKHLSLYIGRVNELGYEFGDFPLNDFFWRQMEKLKTPAQYTAMMSLTFEAANLDFAQYYANIFRENNDLETAAILDVVLEDEVAHVAFGAYWMKKWRQDKKLWDYYREQLPFPLTPMRAKGIGFDPHIHQRAMGDLEFVETLAGFDDNFKITKRS